MEQDTDVAIAKSILLLFMLVVSAIFVAVPIGVMQIRRVKESNPTRRKFILSLLNCVGGGVFLATGFLHLLPEAIKNMDIAFEEMLHEDQEYPFACFVVCMGFLLVLTIEHVVLSCVKKSQPKVVVNESNCRCKTIIRSELPGITASGLFSWSLMTFKVKQRAIHQGKTSPNSTLSSNLTSSSICDNMRSSSPLVNNNCTEQNDEHQDKSQH